MAQKKTQQKAPAVLNYDLFHPESIARPAPATIDTKVREQTSLRPVAGIRATPRDRSQLPTVAELHRMYDLTNWLYFGGKLPRVRIEYSSRMTSAGSYSAEKNLIRIGRKYHELFPDEIGDTLKHEMIHIRHFNHDSAFRKEAERIGASVRARSHPLLERPPRYIYICPRCGQKYPRQKRLRMASCGDCSPRRKFDPKYKLVLFKSLANK
jgi:predicted SprT family Zn-dependent metalloprotease